MTSRARAIPAVGSLFADRYRVRSNLGQGGMGVVLEGYDEHAGAERALKLLNRPSSRVDAARVVREGRALMRISSPHVVRLFDAAELAPWRPYLVLERLVGQNLAALAPLGEPWPVTHVVACAVQVCDALAAAHAVGIIHRDIKPSNLFLTRDANAPPLVKVLDFGIAKELGPSSPGSSTLTKGSLGSPQFMSPEQIATPRAVDVRTDLWSLGVVMYRLASGRFPFAGASVGELSAAILRAKVPPLEPAVPPPFARLLERCFAKKPVDRWPSALELRDALRALRVTSQGFS